MQAGTQGQLGSQPEAYRVSAGAEPLSSLVDPEAECQANLYSGQNFPWYQDK